MQYAKHHGVSKQYINQLVKAGVLIMRGTKIDVRASDQVLNDKPMPEIVEPPRPPVGEPPPPGQQRTSQTPPAKPVA